MLLYGFLTCVLFACALLAYVNMRGRNVDVGPHTLGDIGAFHRMNPSAASVGPLLVSAWRYSKRNYCPESLLPMLLDENSAEVNSYVCVSVSGPNVSKEAYLDTSAFGFGHYEDPRVIGIDDRLAAVVFTKHVSCRGRICVAIVEPSLQTWQKPLATFEFSCPTQTQKNWMPKRGHNDSILLYASLLPTIYELSGLSTASGHFYSEVPPVALGEWRGSSQIVDSRHGAIGFVHKRVGSTHATRWMPDYLHAVATFESDGTIKYGTPFTLSVIDLPGFVYVSGIQTTERGLDVYVGITDCYAAVVQLTTEQLTNLLQPGPQQNIALPSVRRL